MSILVNKNTRLVVQGITGREGLFHTRQCVAFGTQVVAGVTPGKGGSRAEKIPVFNTVEEGVRKTGANTSMIFVPPAFAADAILEAADAGVDLAVCISEGIPALEMARVKHFLKEKPMHLVGPNCPGVISPPSKCKVGIMPAAIHKPGHVGVISRSGTLTYEAVAQLSVLGIGQSTCIGIGGDPIVGLNFTDAIRLFQEDEETHGIILIGEIGGTAEEEAAAYVAEHVRKPVVAFVAGRTAPPGRRMGHAGAIISGGKGTAGDKIVALQKAGIAVAASPAEIGQTMADLMARSGVRKAK